MNVHKVSAFSYENQGGNPAGVLINDSSLSDGKMLEIAKEVNYSETAFLVSKDDKSFDIRYFSPEMEINFCGHATIASGYIIAQEIGLGVYDLHFNTGMVTINVYEKEGKIITAITSINTHTKDVEDSIVEEFIELFNFSKDDLNSLYPIKKSYSGNYHLIIFLKDKIALENMQYDFEKAKELTRKYEITTISVLYTNDNETIHSRNPFAFGGVYEDPATGSAAIALGEYLRHIGMKKSGKLNILQGFDMNVPSQIFANFENEEGSPITISGYSRIIKD